MSGGNRGRRMLYALQRFCCFFLVVGMIVTCCTMLFVSNLQAEMNLSFTEADIQQAILLMAAQHFSNPLDRAQTLPTASENLLAPYRQWKTR